MGRDPPLVLGEAALDQGDRPAYRTRPQHDRRALCSTEAPHYRRPPRPFGARPVSGGDPPAAALGSAPAGQARARAARSSKRAIPSQRASSSGCRATPRRASSWRAAASWASSTSRSNSTAGFEQRANLRFHRTLRCRPGSTATTTRSTRAWSAAASNSGLAARGAGGGARDGRARLSPRPLVRPPPHDHRARARASAARAARRPGRAGGRDAAARPLRHADPGMSAQAELAPCSGR